MQSRMETQGRPRSVCDNCKTTDCTNPIYDVNVNVVPFGQGKERLYLDPDNIKKKKVLGDYWCVLDCKGFSPQETEQPKEIEHAMS